MTLLLTSAPAPCPALDAHCRRVAVLAEELMVRLSWSPGDRAVVREAVELHHSWLSLMERGRHGHVLDDLMSPEAHSDSAHSGAARRAPPPNWPHPDRSHPDRVHKVLEVLGKNVRVSYDPGVVKMAQLVELCCFYAARWEFSPFERADFPQLIHELSRLAEDGYLDSQQVELLSRMPSVDKSHIGHLCATHLRLSPQAADFVRALATPGLELSALALVIHRDPDLRRELQRLAQSPLLEHPSATPVVETLALVGRERASILLLSDLLQPMFPFSEDRELWKHSLQVARFSADLLEKIRGEEWRMTGYLCGLLHDIGRLILHHLAPNSAARYARMIAGGAECQFAEVLLCGFDHCEAGVEILRRWQLPETLVDAIAHHHDPENSEDPLASVLYLAEYQTASEEDAPSLSRLHYAAARCGLPLHSAGFADFAKLA